MFTYIPYCRHSNFSFFASFPLFFASFFPLFVSQHQKSIMLNLVKLVILSLFLTLASSKVIELDEDTWADLLEGEWMVEL